MLRSKSKQMTRVCMMTRVFWYVQRNKNTFKSFNTSSVCWSRRVGHWKQLSGQMKWGWACCDKRSLIDTKVKCCVPTSDLLRRKWQGWNLVISNCARFITSMCHNFKVICVNNNRVLLQNLISRKSTHGTHIIYFSNIENETF